MELGTGTQASVEMVGKSFQNLPHSFQSESENAVNGVKLH